MRIGLDIVEFRGWGIQEETWGLAYEVLAGDPSTKALWDTLDQHLERTFTHPLGHNYQVLFLSPVDRR